MLYIISTPIGNLKDITLRAVETLKSVDLIAAEDTRRAGTLLRHLDIQKNIISYNEKNEYKRIPEIISMLKEEKNIALVSDSGTPLISDPGFKLVREAIKEDIVVTSIPGPCASIAALTSSGLPTDKFAFYGFLTKKKQAKIDFLKSLDNRDETIIIYESPYRIEKTLNLMKEIIPQKNIVIARELTKKFEEFLRGTPEDIIKKIGNKKLKGEIVILIGKQANHKSSRAVGEHTASL